MTTETMDFGADVGRVLDIVARSLYSQREVFLRELISNAADACDRLRYEAIAAPELLGDDAAFAIHLIPDPEAGTLTLVDNGVGMSREDLINNLGTIAKSGTLAAMQAAAEAGSEGPSLIGQFGVGFYSAFMVSTTVEVLTRKAGEAEAWRWVSDGKGKFTVESVDTLPDGMQRGTRVVLSLNDDSKEFVEPERLKHVVRSHSDHVGIPVYLHGTDEEPTEEGEEASEPKGPEQINRAAALWTRSKSEITEEEYKDFYAHVGHGYDEPYLTLHWRAEGMAEYTVLAFVPSVRPFDLFTPERKHQLRLYVRRVFIGEATEGLLPGWLRFLKGVVDSEDLPLNVSRETLQSNPMIARIRKGLVKRVLNELERKAKDEEGREAYTGFWEAFGPVLKEGLYEDRDNTAQLLTLSRFKSTVRDGWISLAEYVAEMRPGQNTIYVLSGEDEAALRRSPQLEGFNAKGVEVLLLTDPVDEFWVSMVGSYTHKPDEGDDLTLPFKSVTRGGADLSEVEAPEEDDAKAEPEPSAEQSGQVDHLIAAIKLTLGETVKDVRRSERLTDSPVCLIADENDMDLHLERLLKQNNQLDTTSRRILELNPRHPLILGLASNDGESARDEAAWLLLDQAKIIEGEPVADPTAFAKRLSDAMLRGIGG